MSERRACNVIGQARTTQRYQPQTNDEKEMLRNRVTDLASEYGRYGYRQVTNLLNNEGWKVGKDVFIQFGAKKGYRSLRSNPKGDDRVWLMAHASVGITALSLWRRSW
ncbi:MAG: hypothetical protein IPJ71_15675 [Bdellovibrionales bacterium]|nr:hypothetical protein [Bdellovibrionales bacterium]